MYNAEKLEGGTETTIKVEFHDPKNRRQIHVYVNRERKELVVDPRGLLEAEAQAEIVLKLGFPLRGGARDIVLKAGEIIMSYGWQNDNSVARRPEDASSHFLKGEVMPIVITAPPLAGSAQVIQWLKTMPGVKRADRADVKFKLEAMN